MTEWDITGDYDPPTWPEPADDPDTEPDEDWAKDADPNPDPKS